MRRTPPATQWLSFCLKALCIRHTCKQGSPAPERVYWYQNVQRWHSIPASTALSHAPEPWALSDWFPAIFLWRILSVRRIKQPTKTRKMRQHNKIVAKKPKEKRIPRKVAYTGPRLASHRQRGTYPAIPLACLIWSESGTCPGKIWKNIQ